MAARGRTLTSAALLLVLATSLVALANIPDPAIVLTATNATGTATFQRNLSQFTYDPLYGEYSLDVWGQNLNTPTGQYVAKLNGLHVFLCDQPAQYAHIIMNFSVDAGNTDTQFTVAPSLVAFPTIPAAASAGTMSWAFVVADRAQSGDAHVHAAGLPAGQDIYRASYNGGTPFGNSVTGLEAWGAEGVASLFDNYPPQGGFVDIPVAVSSMDAVTSFSLTKMDNADIQTTFVLDAPEPATIGLLLGLTALAFRKR
jgi:hypothetical protein